MKNQNSFELDSFTELVDLKYQIYNGLFLSLPFDGLEDKGMQLPIFNQLCSKMLSKGKTPTEIVSTFLKKLDLTPDSEQGVSYLFLFLQLIERQIVLFDALEDAAFTKINDFSGPGTLDHLLSKVKIHNKENSLKNILDDYRVRLVLTAHPTQFYPNTILSILYDLCHSLQNNKLKEIYNLLFQMGLTQFKNQRKPTPLEEAESLIWYLENSFYKTISTMRHELHDSIDETISQKPIIELGFWPGGDRDGNPFVTPNTTEKVANLLKTSILKLYLKDLEKLKRKLTFPKAYDVLLKMEKKLELSIQDIDRQKVNPESYQLVGQFKEDYLFLLKLVESEYQSLFVKEVQTQINNISSFGFHFASMDLRQDSRVLNKSFNAVLSLGLQKKWWSERITFDVSRYDELDEYKKLKLIERLLKQKSKRVDLKSESIDPLIKDTVGTIEVAKRIQKRNGLRAMHRFIISNTQSTLNLFELLYLFKVGGWSFDPLTMDIVPLFETIEDLLNSHKIMKVLYENSFYAEHLKTRSNEQTVMLGFSDGTKDGGYFTANWNIYLAKERLSQLSRDFNIKVVFFDGRGGPPARGGGNTHQFYRSLGSSIDHYETQLTIQGQTISSNFGLPKVAQFNLEQLFTSGIEPRLFPDEIPGLKTNEYQLMDLISQYSFEFYESFKKHPLFLRYLEEITPLNYYGMLNVGSRPAKRSKSSKLKFEDLRAIPFVGAWSQMKQNISGFFGLGCALEKIDKEGKFNDLKDLYRHSLFFKTLIGNSMQSLAKSNFTLTKYLEKNETFGEFWKLIYDEASRTKKYLLKLTDSKRNLEDDLVKKASIGMREKMIVPLLVIQHFAMQETNRLLKERSSAKNKKSISTYKKLIIKSLAANINASRNSA